jgi:hypothetical protein
MSNISNLRIPEFIYLDDQKVDMTLSVIDGSIPVRSRSQRSDTSSKRSGGSLGFQGVIGVQGGLESSSTEELEEVKEQNEYSRFSRLYQLLQERDGITSIEKMDANVHKQLQRGQIVEIEGHVTLSPLDMIFRLLTDLMPLVSAGQTAGAKDLATTKAILSLLQKGQRKGIDTFIFPGEQREFRFYTMLLIEKLKASINEFPCTLITLGRITKILAENETENLMSKYFAGLQLPKDTLQGLVDIFSNDPNAVQLLGNVPSLDDMLIKYPAVAFSPIAMYR